MWDETKHLATFIFTLMLTKMCVIVHTVLPIETNTNNINFVFWRGWGIFFTLHINFLY